jgi:hypothetical protein
VVLTGPQCTHPNQFLILNALGSLLLGFCLTRGHNLWYGNSRRVDGYGLAYWS